jgi:hypothetical protein
VRKPLRADLERDNRMLRSALDELTNELREYRLLHPHPRGIAGCTERPYDHELDCDWSSE